MQNQQVNDSGRVSAIQTALARHQKRFGKDSVFVLGEGPSVEVERWSSGSMGLDHALGGGLPKGRIIEIYGAEGSGKTTMALAAAAAQHRLGNHTAYIDLEHAIDPVWAEKLGCDPSLTVFSQPDSGEDAFELALSLVQSRAVSLIVFDSVAACTPRAEIDGDMGESLPGLQARLMGQGLRKLNAAMGPWCTVIFINQIRLKIGVLPHQNPETTTGGRGLPFYASVRIDVRKTQAEEGDMKAGEGRYIGHMAKCKVVKNKVSQPFKEALVPISYDRGLDYAADCIQTCVRAGIVDRSGSWYSMTTDAGQELRWQGLRAATEALRADPVLMDELRKRAGGGKAPTPATTADGGAEAGEAVVESSAPSDTPTA